MEASQGRMNERNDETPHRCEVCDASFANEGSLRLHQLLQHRDVPDSFEVQASQTARVQTDRPYGRLPVEGTAQEGEWDPPTRRSEEPPPRETIERGGTKVDEELMPEEDHYPAPSANERSAPPITQESEFVRSNGRRSSRRRRLGNPSYS
jgi:hypothetical protein